MLARLSRFPTRLPIYRASTMALRRAVKDVEIWGHRGASAHLPENTLASFRAAIAEGCDGIESADGVVLMFHDPTLDRTTTGKGAIREQPWAGVIEHVRTNKEPIQPIPQFEELIALLMEDAHRHVVLNIDCKMQNDPERLFPEMARIIRQYPSWETALAPRLVLGLWHPLFLRPALAHLPLLTRYYIGFSSTIARDYFWDACSGFSLNFATLVSNDGQRFYDEARRAGKEVCVWTVNGDAEMRTALGWGVRAIMTDRVAALVKVKQEVVADPAKLAIPGLAGYLFPWSNWKFYSASRVVVDRIQSDLMRRMCYQPGPLSKADLSSFLPGAHDELREAGVPSPPNEAAGADGKAAGADGKAAA